MKQYSTCMDCRNHWGCCYCGQLGERQTIFGRICRKCERIIRQSSPSSARIRLGAVLRLPDSRHSNIVYAYWFPRVNQVYVGVTSESVKQRQKGGYNDDVYKLLQIDSEYQAFVLAEGLSRDYALRIEARLIRVLKLSKVSVLNRLNGTRARPIKIPLIDLNEDELKQFANLVNRHTLFDYIRRELI